MTRKQLKKLRRVELLEMLLEQSKELEAVKKELAETKKQLEEREVKIENAGSLAEAALVLNNIFETAQNAADEYLFNIKRLNERQEEIFQRKKEECKEYTHRMIERTNQTCSEMKKRTIIECKDKIDEIKTGIKNSLMEWEFDIDVPDDDNYDLDITDFNFDIT